jgi:hypothetical protein
MAYCLDILTSKVISFLILDMEWFPTTYVLCNPDKEKDRYAFLQKHLLERGIPYEKIIWVCGPWGDSLKSNEYFAAYEPFKPHFGLEKPLSFKSHSLSKGEISLVLTFIQAINHAIQSKDEMILIFESDVILRKDFVSRLKTVMESKEAKEADYISLGEGVGTRPVDIVTSYFGEQKLYNPPTKYVFRCTDSMLFKRSMLEKIRTTIVPFRECLDWELNIQFTLHSGKALWADPPLVEQGSGRARYTSLLPS